MNFNVVELRKTTLAHVPADKVFWVSRGDRIDNVYDLANCVESLTPEQFRHHVSVEGKRNDFATWVMDVLNNPLLANDLNLETNLKDQKHLVKTIRDHVAWLEHA